MSGPAIGDPAPDFELPGSDGRSWRLSALRGQPVILVFYPGDDTPTCTKQMCSYTDHWDDLTSTGVMVLGISAQDLDSHARFSAKHGLKIPLLADTEKSVIAAYGADGMFGITKRATFLIDAEGIVRWGHVDPLGVGYRKPAELIERVRQLQTR